MRDVSLHISKEGLFMSALTQPVALDAVMDLSSSYVDCLRTINAAAQRGVTFDMDACLQPVVGLPPDSLELLIGMAQDYNSQVCQERSAINREKGVRYGRPKKALSENFFTEAERWLAGEISSSKAAQNCKMSPSTFRLRAKQVGLTSDKGDNAQQSVSI